MQLRLIAALLLVTSAAHAQSIVQTCTDSGAAQRAPLTSCNNFGPQAPAANQVVLAANSVTYDWSQTWWGLQESLSPSQYVWSNDHGWVLKSQVAFPTGSGPSNPPTTPTTPVGGQSLARYMPLGDSLTEGSYGYYRNPAYAQLSYEGYRGMLALLLANAGYQSVSVGSLTSGGNDQFRHEGHGGFTISQLAAGATGWVQSAQPTVVLLMIGTNDAWFGNANAAPPQLDALIRQIYAASTQYMGAAGARILVATLPPQADPYQNAGVAYINAAIPGIVAQVRASGINASTVDMSSITLADLSDGIHLYNDAYALEAQKWFAAMTAQ